MLNNKRVLVNGCSFSRGPNSWPYQLQEACKFDLVNLAQGAAGNLYIHNATIAELAKREYDFVMIMWSGLERVDIQVNDISLLDHILYTSDKQSKLNDWPEKIIIPVNDQDYVEKNWVFVCTYQELALRRLNFCQTNYKYQSLQEHLTQSLIHMISLQSILKQLNIPYVFSYYQNYQKLLKQHYLYKLLDTSKICDSQNIWDITVANKWKDHTDHPNPQAHAAWADVLKTFIDENIHV